MFDILLETIVYHNFDGYKSYQVDYVVYSNVY